MMLSIIKLIKATFQFNILKDLLNYIITAMNLHIQIFVKVVNMVQNAVSKFVRNSVIISIYHSSISEITPKSFKSRYSLIIIVGL